MPCQNAFPPRKIVLYSLLYLNISNILRGGKECPAKTTSGSAKRSSVSALAGYSLPYPQPRI